VTGTHKHGYSLRNKKKLLFGAHILYVYQCRLNRLTDFHEIQYDDSLETIVAFSFSSSFIKFGTEDVHKSFSDCGFREYKSSDMHTKGLNELLSVLSIFIVRLVENLCLRCAPNDTVHS
jgi:hypothetical protein